MRQARRWRRRGVVRRADARGRCARRPRGRGAGRRVAPTPGWTAASTPAPTGPDTPGANPNATWASVSCVSAVFCAGAGQVLGDGLGPAAPRAGDRRDLDDPGGAAALQRHGQHDGAPDLRLLRRRRLVRRRRLLLRYHRRLLAARPGRDARGRFVVPSRCAGPAGRPERVARTTRCCSRSTARPCRPASPSATTTAPAASSGSSTRRAGAPGAALVAPQPAAAAADQQVSVSDVACPALGPCAATGTYEAASSPIPDSRAVPPPAVVGRCVVSRGRTPPGGVEHGRQRLQQAVGRLVRRRAV